MAEYQVIARKWRPQRFADVVGQEHVLTTLKNAVKQNRTAHAYLFVGPRGIGKTTTARIFAKALNCESPKDGEPCCRCFSCLAIAAENNIDVIEIDAASQNSVDNIRGLRDEVMHVPVNGRYKIYIIDEVHMLSKQAWNALLKTVEEPPPHVKFIFATTEAHMVLPTIVSRCQRFDLMPISSRLILERLIEIAKAENVRISRNALEAIARAADGGMRDAQSLLDQMIAFFGNDTQEITAKQVLSLFGLTAAEDLEQLLIAMLANQPGEVVNTIHQLAARGKNLETLFNDILTWLRGIQLCLILTEPENVLEEGTETLAVYRRLSQTTSFDIVQSLLENLAPIGRSLHDALNKQVFIETIILKSIKDAHATSIEQIIARLNQLRTAEELKFLDKIPSQNDTPLPQASPVVSPPSSTPTSESIQVSSADNQPQNNTPHEPEAPENPDSNSNTSSKSNTLNCAQKTTEEVAEKNDTTDNYDVPVREEPKATSTIPEISKDESLPVAEVTPADTATLNDPVTLWRKLVKETMECHQLNPMLAYYMKEGTPEKCENNVLTVVFDDEFEPEHYQNVLKVLPQLTDQLQKMLQSPTTSIKLLHRCGVSEVDSKHDLERKRSLMNNQELVSTIAERKIVKTTLDLFGGEIADVHG